TQAGQPSSVPVYIIGALDQSSAKSLGLRSVDLALAWNTDLLSPIGVVSPIIGASISKFNATKTSVTFTVTFPAGFTFGTPTEIATINCIAFVTDTMTTDAEVVTSVFHAAGSCLTVASSTGNVKFTLAPICSDPTLTSYLAHGLPFAIKSIIPNPTSGELKIEVSGNILLHYDLSDVLGHVLRSGTLTDRKLNIQSIPSGSYYLRLSGGGYAVTRRVVRE
ncbi:MAG: T9SS type A sorting domain-containing protein, partial [Candidatus Kapaibacterium sp.]